MRSTPADNKLVVYASGIVALLSLGVMGCNPSIPPGKSSASAPALADEGVPQPVPVVADAKRMDPEAIYLSGGSGAFAWSALDGRVTLVDVAATWSPAWTSSVERLNVLQERFREQGLLVVSLLVDEPVDAGVTVARGAVFPVVAMPRSMLSRWAGVRAVPTRLLLGRDGRVVQIFHGAAPWIEIEMQLEFVLAGG